MTVLTAADLTENLPIGFLLMKVIVDQDGRLQDFLISDTNSAFEKIVGRERQQLLDKPFADFGPALSPDDANLFVKLKQVVITESAVEFMHQIKPAGAWYKATVFLLDQETLVALFSEISVQLPAFSEFDPFFNISPDIMCITERDGCFIRVNPACARILGYSVPEMVGRNIRDFVHPDDLEDHMAAVGQLDVQNHPVSFVNRFCHKNGTYRYFQWSVLQNSLYYCSVARDITENLEKQQEIAYLSFHDSLTGLYNRRFLDEEIKRLNTSRNLPISIIMGDLNQLKLVNDAFGRETGDKLIKTVAGAIQRGCRSEDLAARWDGDLFIIFLPKTKTADAEFIVQRILNQIDLEHVNNIHIKVSFGIATQVSLDQGISETIRLAEDAMLAKKNQENAGSRGDILKAITSTFFSRNPEEKRHADIVSSLCHKTAQALGLNTADVNKIALGGLMHDIGKIAVSSETLDKPSALNHEEWQAIRTHPEIGYKIMASIPDMIEVGKAILAHHERYDGDGYPNGVKLDDISLYARIITLADSYATMTTNQAYKPGLARSAAIEEIRRNEGSQFDPEIAEIFINEVVLKQSDS